MPFYPVTVGPSPATPIAVVAATTTRAELPNLWGKLLDDVWAFLRGDGATTAGHNVMVYLDGTPRVEVGVQVAEPFEGNGRVVCSTLPAGACASTVHRGPYHELDEAHAAVKAWCGSHGHRLTGVRWEVYGDHREDPAELETAVCWQIDEEQ
jgi:effector-binding domain-containing protein